MTAPTRRHRYDREHWRSARLVAAMATMSPEEFPWVDDRFREEAHRRAGLELRR